MWDAGGGSGKNYSAEQRAAILGQGLLQGNIQKISQEGSKNTYVIIVNKDCIKSDSFKGPPTIKNVQLAPSKEGSFRSIEQISVDRASDTGISLTDTSICDNAFDSPIVEINKSRSKNQPPPEDVKLNLSNINDDEYDSNVSASNVFLKPELSLSGHDSAIESDLSQNSSCYADNSCLSKSFFCQKSKMNSYVIQSPLVALQQKKAARELQQQQQQHLQQQQHTFPMISPQLVGNRHSKLAFNSPILNENPQTSNARKIFLVTPSSTEGGSGSMFKKSVAYTNEAVPMMGRSFNSPATLLSKANPKAVPTFSNSNISPINQLPNIQLPASTNFVPINPSASPPVYGATYPGPLTSTPVTGDFNPRLQHLKQESATHRPVYIIQSPFGKNTPAVETPIFCNKFQTLDSPSLLSNLSNSNFNNSSGFISASSSLELPDNSSSFDSVTVRNSRKNSADSSEKPVIEIVIDKPKGKISEAWKSLAEVDSRSEPVTGDGAGGVVITADQLAKENDDMIEIDLALGFDSENDPSISSSQESETSESSDKVTLNRSLTNMQWLKGMQLKEENRTAKGGRESAHQTIQWMNLSPEEIYGIAADCGSDKRPPFSYMSMIQMALYSRDDHRMMLKEICKWIEEMFPYYKFTAKPGWKNSIRHNLSLYNIFEREKSKRHGSYWTIKPGLEPKTKQYKERHSNSSNSQSSENVHQSLPCQSSGGRIPIIPMYSSMGQLSAITPQQSIYLQQQTGIPGLKKKGPPPILPRPSPYSGTSQAQTYALIPVNNVNQSFSMNMTSPSPQQPVIVNLTNAASHVSACPSPVTEMSAAVASINMSSASPIPTEHSDHIFCKKPLNIVKQAWLDSMESHSSMDSDLGHSNDMTSSNDIASSNEYSASRSKSKRPRKKVTPELPKPTMYKSEAKRSTLTGSKRRKLQQKERTLLNDSSDEEDDGSKFISNLEKDLNTPVKHEIDDIIMTTSTPFKPVTNSSPDMPSPIRGLTPLRNNSLFDGSFLETLGDRKALGLSPELPSSKMNTPDGSPNLGDSPNTSLLDFNVLPFGSPDKLGDSPDSNTSLGNHNLSRFLSEYGLDPNTLDIADNPNNISWSALQQMVDNMDTT